MNTKQAEATSFVITKKFAQTLLAGALIALCVLPAQADTISRDQWTITFVETNPNPGLTTTGSILVDTPVGPGFVSVYSFSTGYLSDGGLPGVTQTNGQLLFDANTLRLDGHISGSYTGGYDEHHGFDLVLNPGGTWTNTDIRWADQLVWITSGTYTIAGPVPEPSMWIMLSLGLLAIAYRKTRRSLF